MNSEETIKPCRGDESLYWHTWSEQSSRVTDEKEGHLLGGGGGGGGGGANTGGGEPPTPPKKKQGAETRPPQKGKH